ncbi:MAG: HAMP domain-containing sensor histidine kinase [Candidatus Moraniibacteriota bacterium]
MKNFTAKIKLVFGKKNTVVYSTFLIVCIIGIIFFNTYYSLQKFQQSKDALLQKKAVLTEDIFQHVVALYIENPQNLQNILEKIKATDAEILGMSVAVPASDQQSFLVIADADKENIGKAQDYVFNAMAWQAKKTGVAFLDNRDGTRFWTIIKPVLDEKENKIALVKLELSLADADAFAKDAITRVYLVVAVSMLLVLLLVSNHARLFLYVAKAAHLEEIDKMKDDFISMASHELKSPLTALRGYLELMTDGSAVSAIEQKHYLENMGLSVLRLNNLVEDLLDVSRIEQNRIPIKNESVQIQAAASQLIDEMKISASNKNLELNNQIEALPTAYCDLERVKQIVVNLLSNAIKYTQKGSVKITGRFDDKFIYLIFADTGIGMSAEQVKNLFGKFYRITNDKTKNISGTGLGLWISRQLARKMRGDILVESMEGVGSRFTLKIPRTEKS